MREIQKVEGKEGRQVSRKDNLKNVTEKPDFHKEKR